MTRMRGTSEQTIARVSGAMSDGEWHSAPEIVRKTGLCTTTIRRALWHLVSEGAAEQCEPRTVIRITLYRLRGAAR